MRLNKTLVIGVGNILLSDEGVGVHAINYLRTHHAHLADVTYIDGGTLSFPLVPLIEEAERLVVIDATQLNAAAGTIACFIGEAIDELLQKKQLSVHEINLMDLLTMTRLTGRLPPQRMLVGVQPQILTWGDALSADVAAAIPEVADRVVRWVLGG